MRFEKGEKKFGKRQPRTRVDRFKKGLTTYTTETDAKLASFFFLSVDQLNHTLVGGVSVNSLCQQDWLFALCK